MALGGSLPQINLGVQGRALDWFEVLGYRVVEDKATDYAHLKHALSEQFPVRLGIQTTSNLLQIIDKYEERFLNRKIRGSSWESRDIKPNENNRFPNRNRQENWRETRGRRQISKKAIDTILKPVIGRFVSVYMDDVIVTSPSFNEHLDHLNQVFTLLRDAGLTLNKDKCHFARDKLKYLGLVISKEGIETDHSKLKAITEMKLPKNKAQDSFDKIKRVLTEAPILQLPNFTEQFNLFTDASGVGICAVLNQNHRPIAFASRTLNKAE
ncbi:retrovirus-related Pol polyprotein from transposon 297 [Trichonephila clavipes]|nr:retrovirus-related Pol polyprotein from transposon 297 [Trichonephila clavipes]